MSRRQHFRCAIMSGIEVDTAQQRNATQDISRSVQIAASGTLDV